MSGNKINVRIASQCDLNHVQAIVHQIELSAKIRGTGINKRPPELISKKIMSGEAVIATTDQNEWVGFCYLQVWDEGKFVANCGLIVSPAFRCTGIAKEIKRKIFDLCRTKYPEASIFGLTTSLAVMRINSGLGFQPVTYSEITQDEEFWGACKACVNHDILIVKQRKNCLCTAMLYMPITKQ